MLHIIDEVYSLLRKKCVPLYCFTLKWVWMFTVHVFKVDLRVFNAHIDTHSEWTYGAQRAII